MTTLRHLHLHTQYSLLDGFCKIDEAIKKAKKNGMKSIAMTDHGNMLGTIDFYRQCKENGIKPIIGMETYIAPDMKIQEKAKNLIDLGKKRKDRKYSLSVKDIMNLWVKNRKEFYSFANIDMKVDEEGNQTKEYRYSLAHLVLLAKNEVGYKNLIKLSSLAYKEGFYYKPRLDMERLRGNCEGIIALSACRGGEIPKLILRNEYEMAKEKALEYNDVFDNFYLELQPSNITEQLMVNDGLKKISKETGIELVVTSDCHYVEKEDANIHDIILCMNTGSLVDDEDRFSFDGDFNYMMTEKDVLEFKDIPYEAIKNTKEIANMCNVELEMDNIYLPPFNKPKGFGDREYIEHLCWKGVLERTSTSKVDSKYTTKEYWDRITYELDIIEDKGYIDYFLIVWDFIKYAKKKDILVGPGRGSAAGCMVSYMLRITNINPFEYGLIFERFLNPERMSLPDIDIDFEDQRRHEVVEYVTEEYGKDYICQIIALNTMQTSAAIKDTSRPFNVNFTRINAITKSLTDHSAKEAVEGSELFKLKPIEDAVKLRDELVEEYGVDIFKIASRLEGMPRHTSVHAAGIIIAPEPVHNIIPLRADDDGNPISQFNKDIVESIGLLKMDFLGLTTLSLIKNTVESIKKRHNVTIDLDNFTYDDKEVLNLIREGRTDGVFQVESSGFKKFLKDFNEFDFNDLIAAISLYRPGPMDYIPQYVACRNGEMEPEYLFEDLKPILGDTYAVIVYQEQVMEIATKLAGFTMGQADKFRKAIGKKDEDLIKEQLTYLEDGSEEKNIKGLKAAGYPIDKVKQLSESIVEFARYAFNKSHAAGYAVLSYITAYLKRYYLAEFMTELINIKTDKHDKMVYYVQSAREEGLGFLSPSVNNSESKMTIQGDEVRFGFYAIKGVSSAGDFIVEERNTNGLFKSVEDFVERCPKGNVNKTAIRALCFTGAFNEMSDFKDKDISTKEISKYVFEKRGYSIENIDEEIEKYTDKSLKLSNAKQLFSKEFEAEYSQKVKLAQLEKSYLGVYIKEHPLDNICEDINWKRELIAGNKFSFNGMIVDVYIHTTKNDNKMAFLTIQTVDQKLDVVVFPSTYDSHMAKIDKGGIRTFHVEVQRDNRDPSKNTLILGKMLYYRG